MQDANVTVITHGGAMKGEDIPFPQIQLDGKKKLQFDVDAERDTFFEARYAIRRDPGKLFVYEMLNAFDSTLVAGPSR